MLEIDADDDYLEDEEEYGNYAGDYTVEYEYPPFSDMEYDMDEVIKSAAEDFNNTQLHKYAANDSRTKDLSIKSITMGFHGKDYKCIIYVVTEKHLTDDDIKNVISYLEGQMSDGWGEGYSQKNLAESMHNSDHTALYLQFWWNDKYHPWKITAVDIEDDMYESTNISKEVDSSRDLSEIIYNKIRESKIKKLHESTDDLYVLLYEDPEAGMTSYDEDNALFKFRAPNRATADKWLEDYLDELMVPRRARNNYHIVEDSPELTAYKDIEILGESTDHDDRAKLGKRVKQVKGWKIYQGTDAEGNGVFRLFTPDEDHPAIGYEDWQTDSMEEAEEWISNY